jgi:hypothetical protein
MAYAQSVAGIGCGLHVEVICAQGERQHYGLILSSTNAIRPNAVQPAET